MAVVEVYFDESGSHRQSPILCVAGYLFEREECKKLNQEFHAIIDPFNLPYFRMSACANGTKPFNRMTMDQRIEVEKKLIALVNTRMTLGIAVTVEPDLYIRVMPYEEDLGVSPYSFAARSCLTGVRQWADATDFTGDIAYIFESGHRSQPESNAIMNRLFKNPKLKQTFRYVSHTFVDKARAPGLQAADLLAWHWHTARKRVKVGNMKPRLDSQALLLGERVKDYHTLHFDEAMLRDMAARSRKRSWFEGRS